MKRTSPVFLAFFLFFGFTVFPISGNASEPEVPPLKIVYFIPSDARELEDREERLGRVMKCVQDFYREGMEKNGFGPKTFALEWNSPGKLRLYTVHGKKQTLQYGRSDASVVRAEVRDALLEQGIDINNETIVIFQLLLHWEDGKATEIGPYVGGGSHYSGTAWVYEDRRLDSRLLSSKEPGGYYHRPCSLGKFNTHYIGGLAHELGHALSLPHDCETDAQRGEFGRSLMGGGNHTFGENLREEGKGTFLSPASALRLSKVRAFVGDLPEARNRVQWDFEELRAEERKFKGSGSGLQRILSISGKVSANPKLLGIIAYNDNVNVPSDYDAKTWCSEVDEQGNFQLEIGELLAVPYQLRLIGIHENGASSRLVAEYRIEADRPIDLSAINDAVPLDRLRRAFLAGNSAKIKELGEEFTQNPGLKSRAHHLLEIMQPRDEVDISQVPGNVESIDLSTVKFSKAQTGWGPLRRNCVPEDVFLSLDGRFIPSGLYAHAPSEIQVDLGGRWKTLEIGYGLQDGHDGPVRFLIRGDGKDLHRSEIVEDHEERRISVSVEGVRTLELFVEFTEAGKSGTWGIWTTPMLKR